MLVTARESMEGRIVTAAIVTALSFGLFSFISYDIYSMLFIAMFIAFMRYEYFKYHMLNISTLARSSGIAGFVSLLFYFFNIDLTSLTVMLAVILGVSIFIVTIVYDRILHKG